MPRIGAYPGSNAAAAATEGHYRRASDEGLAPAAVADAVQQGRFWVFPQQEFLDLVVRRFEMLAQRLDPTPAAQTPGLPLRSQIVAETRAALGINAPS